MKPIRFSNLFASALVFSMAAANAGTTPAAPTTPAEPAAAANWITFTLGGAFVDGDDANMMRRTGTNGDFYGGIGDFKMTQSLGGAGTLTMDGHALYGLEDYEFNMLLNKEGLGYVKLSYDQFRTWYDGSGGYSHIAGNPWNAPWDDERHLDRMSLGLEAGLRMENLPEVTFRYNYHTREGQKDSLAWGDNVTATVLKPVPGLWNIDEEVHTFELDVEHTLGKTDLGLGLTYEHTELNNGRYTPRGLNAANLTERLDSDLFSAHVTSVTRFSDNLWLTFAAAYTTMDSDIDGGSRAYTYGLGGAPGVRDYAYNTMLGGSNLNQFVTNLNLMWQPVADLSITPSLRYEHESVRTLSGFQATTPVDLNNNAILTNLEMFNALASPWKGPQALSSDTDMDALTAAVDVRYRGIENVVLYGSALAGYEEESIMRAAVRQPTEWLGTEVEITEQEFTLGANWYPLSNLSFSAQGLYAGRQQSLQHGAGPFPANTNFMYSPGVQTALGMPTNTAAERAARDAYVNGLTPAELQAALAALSNAGMANNLRPIMLDHETEMANLNLRATWRPMNCLSLVTRYDYRQTEFENRGLAWSPPNPAVFFRQIQSGEVSSHIISESVTWSPLTRLYLQGTIGWVNSETDTPMRVTTPDSRNDYLTASLSAGYAISDSTDLTATYNYYGSSDYTMALNSMGYGLETEEHSLSLTLTHIINPNMVWNLSYAYIISDTTSLDQSGGFNDFDAHMVSTGLQIRF